MGGGGILPPKRYGAGCAHKIFWSRALKGVLQDSFHFPLRFRAPWTVSPEKCGVSMMLCALTKHAAIVGSLWLQYRIFPKGISTAVLPVREKTIGVIAIVEMCEKCSHFRLMMAVEEMKIAQPETCEKYFVYYKVNLHESCGNLHRHWSSAVFCLNKNFIYVFANSIKKKERSW